MGRTMLRFLDGLGQIAGDGQIDIIGIAAELKRLDRFVHRKVRSAAYAPYRAIGARQCVRAKTNLRRRFGSRAVGLNRPMIVRAAGLAIERQRCCRLVWKKFRWNPIRRNLLRRALIRRNLFRTHFPPKSDRDGVR